MLRERDLKLIFWLVYLSLVLVCVRNVVTDDWLLTPLVAVLSVLLILLCLLRPVASRLRWTAVAALMGAMLVMAVILREVLWIKEYSMIDRRVLFLISLTLIAVIGRLSHAWRMRRRYDHSGTSHSSSRRVHSAGTDVAGKRRDGI